jgi:hypothetical protein
MDGLAFWSGPFGSLADAGQPRSPDGRGGAVVLPGQADQRAGFVLAAERDRRAGAQRQRGLALLHGLVASRWVVVGRDAEVRVEPVEGVLGVDGGQRPPKHLGVVGLVV